MKEAAFKVSLQNGDHWPLVTALVTSLCVGSSTSGKDAQPQGWTHLTRNKMVSCSLLCSSGVIRDEGSKSSQTLPPVHTNPSSGDHHDL